MGLAILIPSCGGGRPLFLDRPWDPEQTVVLVAVDADGVPLGAPVIKTGETVGLEFEDDPPFTLIAWTFAPEVLAPTCAVSFDEGLPLPNDHVVWTASIVARDGIAAFVETNDAAAIEVRTTCVTPRICPTLDLEPVVLLPELASGNIVEVLPLSSTRVLLASGQASSILEIDGDARRLLDTSALSGVMKSLARDGDFVYGATLLQAFRFDLATETFEVETPSRVLFGLEPVPGGAPVIYGDFGIEEAFTTAASATTAIERLETKVRHMLMVSKDHGFVIDDYSAVHGYNGEQWILEQPGSEGLTLESVRRSDGDERYLMTVGKRENLYLRTDEVWSKLPEPYNRGLSFHDVQYLGGGRFFVVGEFGHAALLHDGAWCTYDLGTDLDVERIGLAPDGRTLFAGTELRGGGSPELLRFTIR